MSTKRILIVDDLDPVFISEVSQLGYVVDYFPDYKKADALAVIKDYEVLVIRTKFIVDKEFIDAAVNLKFIARAGAGMDNIDEDYASQEGIVCVSAGEGNRDAVGEHAISMLLALYNNLRKADAEVRKGIWDREGNRGFELKGRTVGLIGYGNTGQMLAKKLSGFEVNVLAYDKYKAGFSDDYAREVSMEEIVKHTDILSLHIPLTAETKQMVNDEYLFHFKKPIVLINTARGEIVNTKAVLKAIKSGKLAGACLDVLEVEKFPALGEQNWYKELSENDKVILSPHVAGWTFESYRKISEVMAEKLKMLQSTF